MANRKLKRGYRGDLCLGRLTDRSYLRNSARRAAKGEVLLAGLGLGSAAASVPIAERRRR